MPRFHTVGTRLRKKSRRLFRAAASPAQTAPLLLRHWSSAAAKAHKEHDHENDQEYEEKDLRNPDRRTRDAGEPEYRRDEAEDQEGNCPT
jgi:hypothetical protein